MVATSGDRLIDDDAVAAVRDELLPVADLVTPNVPEAAALLGADPATTEDELPDRARALAPFSLPPKGVAGAGSWRSRGPPRLGPAYWGRFHSPPLNGGR